MIDVSCLSQLRTRQQTLDLGDPCYNSMSYNTVVYPPPSNPGVYIGFSQASLDAKPALASSITKTTRDYPRRFSDKRTLTQFNGRSLRRWSYLPFWTTTERRGFTGGLVHNGNEIPKACFNSVDARYVYWGTRSPDTQYRVRPYIPKNVANLRYVSTQGLQHGLPTPQSFLSWMEVQNYTPLVAKLLDNLDAAMSNFPDMLVVFAELREVLDLFKMPSNIQSAYLQNSFGVQPTIASIKDTAGGIAHRWNELAMLKTVKCTYKFPSETVNVNSTPTYTNSCFGKTGGTCRKNGFTGKKTRIIEAEAKLEVLYSVVPPPEIIGFLSVIDKFLERVNALGDLSTLWELVPFSWMIDWFVPMGTRVKAASAKAGLGKYWGLVIHDAFLSVRRCITTEVEDYQMPCFHERSTTWLQTEDYARIPFEQPSHIFNLCSNSVSIPTRLSQALTFAALAMK